MSSDRLEAPAGIYNVESAYAHVGHICHTGEPEADDNDEIAKEEDRTLEVVALTLTVHVAEEENA